MTEDFYDLLDVPSDASQDEIKEAYREQVRVYHPDLNDDDRAQAQFTAVKKAYDILGDPVERQAYDRLGHEDYVAKRTSGLPSPDVWQSTDDGGDDDPGADEADRERAETTATAGATATGTSGSASTSSTGTDSRTSGSSASTASAGTTSSGPTAGTSGSATGTAGATGTGGATSSTDGGTAHGTAAGTAGSTDTAGTSRSRSTAETGWFGDNALARWWRRQNFSLPLIWLSVLVYLTGLGDFALANESALEALRADLIAAGTDVDAVAATLTGDRYGIDSSVEYLTGYELVDPPLAEPLWYAALAGVVALTLVALVGVRAYRDGETWRRVTIDETIVVALAVTATTVLVGGPLLAGAVLMPFLFAVIVRRTRRLPGWKPSYLYLAPVLAPLAGFAGAAVVEPTLAVDLATLIVLPVLGGLALPLRATIRKRFGT